jgi:MFS family permease
MSVAEQAGAPAAPEPDRAHGVNPWRARPRLPRAVHGDDATIVNVALPSIQDDLGFSATELQWVINSYTLAFGGFLLLGGRAADLVGRRGVVMLAALLRKEDVANVSP